MTVEMACRWRNSQMKVMIDEGDVSTAISSHSTPTSLSLHMDITADTHRGERDTISSAHPPQHTTAAQCTKTAKENQTHTNKHNDYMGKKVPIL